MAAEPNPSPLPEVLNGTRRWPRHRVAVPVRVILRRNNKLLMIEGRGNELNEGGMAVFAGVELRIGETVDIEFMPPYQGTPVRVPSTVRDRRGYYYGIEFVFATSEDEKKVNQIRLALQSLGSPALKR
jgi:PilZ domain-containing protein